uniref:Alkaline ceramidase n=1 Tax=Oncorhynchus mykiss TaxID=8022 RepID=A0A8C7NLA4_ONCMY
MMMIWFYSSEKMTGLFAYESSDLDWCEDNYRHSENIVEYFNTVKMYLSETTLQLTCLLYSCIERGINMCPLPTGLFSAYFHMTLSFMGQMLDELSILWVLGLCYGLWFPRRLFPSFIKDRTTFSRLVMMITVVTTLCSFVKPTANAYLLNCFALHIIYSLGLEMRICTDPKVLRLCWSAVGLWVLAISCWISDRFGCSFWQKLNFCYLHGIWHILIVMAVAYASTLIAYLDANYEIPSSLPSLQYWPNDNWVLGLPYIVLKGTTKTQKIF